MCCELLANSGGRVGSQCWEVGVKLHCAVLGTNSAINEKTNNLVCGRIDVKIVMLTYIELTFELPVLWGKNKIELC